MTFKALGRDGVSARSFKVHKSQIASYVSGSGVIAEMNVATARRFPLVTTFASGTIPSGPASGSSVILTQSFLELTDFGSASAQNEDGTFQEPLFSSVSRVFYASGAVSGTMTFAAGGDGFRDFPLSESVYVVNVAQGLFGEEIRPGTFQLDTPAAGSGTIVEDGRGRLFVSGAGGSLNVVGNVFYSLGVAVVNRLTAASGLELIQETGLHFDSGSTLRAQFEATQQLFEHTIITTLDPMEFNYSLNPSARGQASTGSILDTGSALIQDLIGSGTLSPYVTTIGLYNDNAQLVAVAKLPRPLRRLVNSQQSFIIRFDA